MDENQKYDELRLHTKNFTIDIFDNSRRGYFEHNEVGEDCAGGLWFEDGVLIDYDGVFALPGEVWMKLEEQGFVIEEEFK